MDDVSALDLRVGIERMTASSADLTVRVALSTKTSAQNLRARIEFISAASANLKAGSFGEPESSLAAGWQLAQALGAQVAIETEGNSEVCITLSLPIEMQSRISTQTALPVRPPSANGNDHETHDIQETVPAR